MDSFFNKGFKTAKCKTLLKLTIPRIKLLRNRREIQIKQMRKEIAKLLETSQEATARIRVEHIIREEKMMAAQEIIELFCELIAVRLPIIEAQRECPLDLKEAISSVCFAAPRCADLTELMQVQMLFAGKYGKEFVTAATELMPECGVNRQLIELLSVRAPDPDVKLKLLKEIAEEHELDWDPSASETELLKPHEDLLNGSMQFISGSKMPLPKGKHDETVYSTAENVPQQESDSDDGFESIDFPEVPKQPLRSNAGAVSAPEMLPFPASAFSDADQELEEHPKDHEALLNKIHTESVEVLQEKLVNKAGESSNMSAEMKEEKQFLPFISPLTQSTVSVSVQNDASPRTSRTNSETNVDLRDVLAAAQAAAETAERAAAAARSAAILAEARISELIRKKSDVSDGNSDNPFHAETNKLDHQTSSVGPASGLNSPSPHYNHEDHVRHQVSDIPSYDDPKVELDSIANLRPEQNATYHQPQRLPSMDDEAYFSYPNLFTSEGSNLSAHARLFTDNNSKSSHEQ